MTKVEKNIKQAKEKYIYAVGRRKESRAQVRLYKGSGKVQINGKKLEEYFPTLEMQQKVFFPLELVNEKNKCDASVVVKGGGKNGQVDAIRHGIARTLNLKDGNYRITLKKENLLKRDPRMKERKKCGLKRARRAPQWQKR
jgi:small subunit ribosomal protein S9